MPKSFEKYKPLVDVRFIEENGKEKGSVCQDG